MAELPVFLQDEYEAHVSRWSQLEQQESMIQLEKGAVASSMLAKHGGSGVEKFAWEVGENPSTLYRWAEVYDRISDLPDSPRGELVDALENGTLTYTHVRETHGRIKDDEDLMEILAEAQDEGWRTRRLIEEITVRRRVDDYNPESIFAPSKDAYQELHPDDPMRPAPRTLDPVDYEYEDVDESREVRDAHLDRLMRSIDHACSILAERSDEEILEYVETMRGSLERLERRIRQSSAALGGG